MLLSFLLQGCSCTVGTQTWEWSHFSKKRTKDYPIKIQNKNKVNYFSLVNHTDSTLLQDNKTLHLNSAWKWWCVWYRFFEFWQIFLRSNKIIFPTEEWVLRCTLRHSWKIHGTIVFSPSVSVTAFVILWLLSTTWKHIVFVHWLAKKPLFTCRNNWWFLREKTCQL